MTKISTKQVVQLSDPPNRRIEVQHNRGVVIEYDSSMNTFSRSGADLIISGQSEEEVVLHNFFIENENGVLPEFRLEDGTIIAGEEFLRQEAPDLNLYIVPGSGAGEYQDNAGDLIAGLDRLGSLGTTQWAVARPEVQTPEAAPQDEQAAPVRYEPTYFPPMPPVDPPPRVGPYSYQARAVLHSQDADGAALGDYFVDAAAIREAMTRDAQTRVGGVWGNAGVQADIEYLGGDGRDLLAFQTLPDGTIKFTLTQAALDYFLNTPGNDFIEVYYTVTLNGVSYNMQVIVPNKGEFVSGEYCNHCKYEDHENSGLVFGEWHAGRAGEESGKQYDVVSSNMADIMTYEGALENVNIRTGDASDGAWGADTVTVNCHVAALGGTDSSIVAKGADSLIAVRNDRAGKGLAVAQDGGSVTLDASGDNSTITIFNDDVTGYGLHAKAGSDVIVKAEGDGGTIAAGGGAAVVKTEGGNAGARLTAEDITISGAVNGIDADDSSKVTVTADTLFIKDVEKGSVNRNSEVTLTADAITVNATGENEVTGISTTATTGNTAKTTVTSDGRIDISAIKADDAASNTVTGVYGNNGGSTVISSKEGTHIRAENANGIANGISTNRSDLDLTAKYVDAQAYSDTGNGSGIIHSGGYNAGGNVMNITLNGADDSGFALKAIGTSSGMENRGMGGELYVKNDGGVGDILFKGGFNEDGTPWDKGSYGTHAVNRAYGIMGQGLTNVDAGGMKITTQSHGWITSEGIYSGGKLTIDNASELNVHSHLISDGTVTNDVWRLNQSMGLSTGWHSTLDIKNTDYVNVLATSEGKTGWTAAIGVRYAGFVNVNVEAGQENAIRLEAKAEHNAAGIYHDGDVDTVPQSDIRVGGDKTVTVDVIATATGGNAYGMTGYVFSSSGSMGDAATYIKGKTVNFDISSEGTGNAYMMTVGEGARNFVNADVINATVHANTGDAHGVSIYNENPRVIPGSNTVTGNVIDLNITSEHGNAFGMFGQNYPDNNGSWGNPDSVNTITSEGALTLTITVKAGAGRGAYAMFNDHTSDWSTGHGYTNNIIGNSAAGSSGADADNITLNGDIYAGYYGVNKIQTGQGDDRVEINGNFNTGQGGKNSIDTGDGDDVIILNGRVYGGTLQLRAGNGGDTLVLRVEDETQFESYYRSWFSSMSYAELKAMGIENIRVEGVTTLGLLDWLEDLIYDYNMANPGFTIDFGLNGGPYSLTIADEDVPEYGRKNTGVDDLESSGNKPEAAPQGMRDEISPTAGEGLIPGFDPLGSVFGEGRIGREEAMRTLSGEDRSGMETLQADTTQQPGSGDTRHASATGTESSNALGIHAALQTSNTWLAEPAPTDTESLSIAPPLLKGEEIEMLLRANLYNVKDDHPATAETPNEEENGLINATPQATAATIALMSLLAKESMGKNPVEVIDAVTGFKADDGLIKSQQAALQEVQICGGDPWECGNLVDADMSRETLMLLGPSYSTDQAGYSPDRDIAGGALSLNITMESGKGDLAYFFYAASSDFVINRMQDVEANQEVMLLHGRFGNGSVHVNETQNGDILVLQADTASDFKEFYNDWLGNFFSEVNANVAGVTSVSLEISGQSDHAVIASLERMIDTLNAEASNSESVNFTINNVTSFFTSFIHLDPEYEDALPHHVHTELRVGEEVADEGRSMLEAGDLPAFLGEDSELPGLKARPGRPGREGSGGAEADIEEMPPLPKEEIPVMATGVLAGLGGGAQWDTAPDGYGTTYVPVTDTQDTADLSHIVQSAFVA